MPLNHLKELPEQSTARVSEGLSTKAHISGGIEHAQCTAGVYGGLSSTARISGGIELKSKVVPP
jgi:hypothetical protein